MMETVAQTLKTLFESDTSAEDYFETAPAYQIHHQLGWPPWAPMLCELWALEEPPEWYRPEAILDWQMRRARLLELHEQYQGAMG